MHALRANDRLAVSKLVTQLTRSNVRSPMAQCLLVRYVAQVRPVAEWGWAAKLVRAYRQSAGCVCCRAWEWLQAGQSSHVCRPDMCDHGCLLTHAFLCHARSYLPAR